MAPGEPLRKRRTRQHVIADQSVNHVQRFIIDEGHTAQTVEKDYGYDLILSTFDKEGYAEPGLVLLQIKAEETLTLSGADYVFDLDVRDYHLWMLEPLPVVLVLYDAGRRKAYWLLVKTYFRKDASRRPKKGSKTVRVRVPKRQSFTCRAVARMREHKQTNLQLYPEEGNHV